MTRPSTPAVPFARVLAMALPFALAPGFPLHPASAQEPTMFLRSVPRHTTLTSTVPNNGDVNPYAITVAPISAGKVQKDDVPGR
jgi:hypothetical protein